MHNHKIMTFEKTPSLKSLNQTPDSWFGVEKSAAERLLPKYAIFPPYYNDGEFFFNLSARDNL